jgi:hypothetical protein
MTQESKPPVVEAAKTADILKENPYRWHVMVEHRVAFTGKTYGKCLDYCNRHGIVATRYEG